MPRIEIYPSLTDMVSTFGCKALFDDDFKVYTYKFVDDEENEILISFKTVDASFKLVVHSRSRQQFYFYSDYTKSISLHEDSQSLSVVFLINSISQRLEIKLWPLWSVIVSTLDAHEF